MNGIDKRRQQVINQELRKGGLRGKINAKCAECIYDPYDKGTWLKQVELCTSPKCPLFDARPTPKKGDNVPILDTLR